MRSLTSTNDCVFSPIHRHAQSVLPFMQNTHRIKPDKPSLHAGFALKLLRWAVVLVSGDIVMQNFSGIHTTISNYSMRYQTVGALLAIELLILFSYFYSRKQK